MPDVRVSITAIEIEPGRVIRTTVSYSCTVAADGAGSIIDSMCPRVRAQDRHSLCVAFLELRLQRVVTRAADIARRRDCIRTGNVGEHNLTRSWSALIVAGTNVLK